MSNTDSLIGTLGLNYGVTDKWEIGAKANALYRQTRQNTSGKNHQNSDTHLQDISFITQYQTTENHKTFPNGLIFSEISLYDKTDGLDLKSFSSVLIGGTLYTVNDPIVLSLTGSYQYNAKRNVLTQNKIVDIGDVLSVNGTVGFAVNPDITLNTGVGWQLRQADKINGINLGIKQTQTNLNLGLAYALSQRSNITANIRTNISGDGGSTFSVGLTTRLGKLPRHYRKNTKSSKLISNFLFFSPSTGVLMKIPKILVAGLASTCLTVSAMAEVTNPVNTATPIGATRAAFLGGTVGFAGNQAAISSSQR